jgi:hypothetical protein
MVERGGYPDVYLPEAFAMDGIEMEEAIVVSIDEEDISIALTGWLQRIARMPVDIRMSSYSWGNYY